MSKASTFAMLFSSLIWSGICSGCTGPRPKVEAVHLVAPRSDEQPYLLEVLLHNEGSGEGEVDLSVRLHPLGSQISYEEGKRVSLKGHERVTTWIEVHAPKGQYAIEATAHYPPG